MEQTLPTLLSDPSAFSIIIAVALSIALLAWLGVCYSKLSKLRTEIDTSFEKIDVHIKERHHLALSLTEIVNRHTVESHAAAILINNVVRARHTMATAAERVRAFSNDTSSINSLVNADVALNLALEELTRLQDTCHSLRQDDAFKQFTQKLSMIEGNIFFTHQLYNQVVNSYNNTCATFPSLILAGTLGFRAAGTLTPARRRNAPSPNLSQA